MPLPTAKQDKTRRPPVVLLVDDSDFDRRHARRVLSRCRPDATVFEFDTLSEAQSYLNERTADIVMLDNILPDGVGGSFADTLRGSPRHANTPVLIVTGYSSGVAQGLPVLLKNEMTPATLGPIVDRLLMSPRTQATSPARARGTLLPARPSTSEAKTLDRARALLRAARADGTSVEAMASALSELETLLASGSGGQSH